MIKTNITWKWKEHMNLTKLPLLLLLGIVVSNFSFGQEDATIAAYSESIEGRCVGSAYCSACTNCSRCGHCSSGGSCGVCSTSHRSTPRSTNGSSGNKTSKSYKSKTTIYDLPNETGSKYYLRSMVVNSDVLNLRSGPGTSYSTIERLKNTQKLTFLAMTGSWVKVKVNATHTIGFVYYKLVLILDQ